MILSWFIVIIASTSIYLCEAQNNTQLPENFSLGVSTAAYQIEGAWNTDGRGPSIWDTFTHNNPDKIANGDNGDVTCDSYHKFDKDLQALIDLKVNHYRFSISWTRIMPFGDNSTFNQKGVDYYNYVLNKLTENNIRPIVTMSHYDIPAEFDFMGVMTNSEFIGHFKTYAQNLFTHFGDRVKHWITFNEPIEYCIAGYGEGTYPPAIKKSGIADYLCIQNTLKAHAVAYRLYRKKFYAAQRGKIGISLSTRFFYNKNDDFNVIHRAMHYGFGILAHPIYSKRGGFPEVVVNEIAENSMKENRARSRLPQFNEFWRLKILNSADFIGINYYTSRIVEEEEIPKGPIPSYERDSRLKFSTDPSWDKAQPFWSYVVPDGLEGLLKYVRDQYGNVEVIVTENGCSYDEGIFDSKRVGFIRNHLQAVLNAVADGCNVTGYTVWSLMDNFEWLLGFSQRYGLHHIDFESEEKERKPKLSAKFFAKLSTDREIPPEDFHYY